MENIYSVLVGLLLLVCFVTSGEGIRCFQCSSANDPGCADLKKNDTNSKYYQECADSYGLKPFFCRKTTMQLLDTQVKRVTRSCGTIVNKENKTNCYRADTDYKSEISCQCFIDGCNSVSQTKSAALTSILLVAVAIYCTNI